MIISKQFTETNWQRCQNDWRKIENMTDESFFALAIAGEAGELANIVKKVERGDFNYEQAKQRMADEIADIFTYLDLLCSTMEIDFSSAIAEKFNEVSRRIESTLRVEAGC